MKKLFLLFWLVSGFIAVIAQQQRPFPSSKNLMPTGLYYFPEQFPRTEWNRDFEKIAKSGFEFVIIGSYAWSALEPHPDKFDFVWLDTCIMQASTYGLRVIINIPTAAPPLWLAKLHPEMILVNSKGDCLSGSNFIHVNETNELFENFATRVIIELAKKYGKDRRISGWQLDNEPHIGTLYDYSKTSQLAFKAWLLTKYKSVSSLRKAWNIGTGDTILSDFDKIQIPASIVHPDTVSITELLDFQKYNSDALASILHYQSAALRQNISRSQWITTNFAAIKFLPVIDPFKNSRDLDVFSHTISPEIPDIIESKEDTRKKYMNGLLLSFSTELTKSVKGSSGLIELQALVKSGGGTNEKETGMQLWHSYALGEKFVCSYLFRQLPPGSELSFKSIMDSTGLERTIEGSSFIQAMEEIKALNRHYKKDFIFPGELASRKTAFLWKPRNFWNQGQDPSKIDAGIWKQYLACYSACKSMGAQVEFIDGTENFSPADFSYLIAPACQMLDSNLVLSLSHYVKEGGKLVLASGSVQYDDEGRKLQAFWRQNFFQLAGAEIKYPDKLKPEGNGKIFSTDSVYIRCGQFDQLKPYSGTRVLAETEDSGLRQPAAISHKLGKGTVTYIAVSSVNGQFEKQILRNLFIENKTNILDNPEGVYTEFRDGFWITVNYSSSYYQAAIPGESQILLGRKTVPPAGVLVWKQ